jgi:mRNA-degrading endonuclease RelE of RelBE toxin-antitoxin system
MVDKIQKALDKLTAKEKEAVKDFLRKLKTRQLEKLDIKKLKGKNDIFRVRKGSIRIIYQDKAKNGIFVLTIERRNSNTYNF